MKKQFIENAVSEQEFSITKKNGIYSFYLNNSQPYFSYNLNSETPQDIWFGANNGNYYSIMMYMVKSYIELSCSLDAGTSDSGREKARNILEIIHDLADSEAPFAYVDVARDVGHIHEEKNTMYHFYQKLDDDIKWRKLSEKNVNVTFTDKQKQNLLQYISFDIKSYIELDFSDNSPTQLQNKIVKFISKNHTQFSDKQIQNIFEQFAEDLDAQKLTLMEVIINARSTDIAVDSNLKYKKSTATDSCTDIFRNYLKRNTPYLQLVQLFVTMYNDSPGKLEQNQLLLYAIDHRKFAFGKFLVHYGANVNAQDHHQRRPIHMFWGLNLDGGREAITLIKLLVQRGAETNAVDECQQNILHKVACNNKYLFDRKLNAEMRDLMQLLIECGVDVNQKDYAGKRPLDYAPGIFDVSTNKALNWSPVWGAIVTGVAGFDCITASLYLTYLVGFITAKAIYFEVPDEKRELLVQNYLHKNNLSSFKREAIDVDEIIELDLPSNIVENAKASHVTYSHLGVVKEYFLGFN